MMGDEMNETYDKLIRIEGARESTQTYSDHYWRRVFAGLAMQGLLSNPHATVEMDRDAARMGVLPRNHAVAVAEGYADALLYRLRKREAEDA